MMRMTTAICNALLVTSLLLLLPAGFAQSECFSCTNCAVCTGKEVISDTEARVTISVANCKAGQDISWLACCKDNGCLRIDGCVGELSAINTADKKCDETTGAYFIVSPPTAPTLTVHLHDGKFLGTFSGSRADTCGGIAGSCTSPSGVCVSTVDLTTCPGGTPPECVVDSDCQAQGPCSTGKCTAGKCVQEYKPVTTVCRAAAGPCDDAESCTGTDAACPSDVFKSATTICRNKVIANDGTTCDEVERCTGASAVCPDDAFSAEGVTCRANKDLCDMPEVCTGTSANCPSDVRNDHAYTFKCATTQYLCGVTVQELNRGSGKDTYFLGTCGIGVSRSFVDLPWPACETQCLNALCPNNRGLSNWATATCNKATGAWDCNTKVDVGASTVLPFCPSWP